MVIKATLFVLIILLVGVVALSCYSGVEGFQALQPNKRYNFYLNRFNAPAASPRCLKTLAGNKIGTWDCIPNDITQMWFLNENGNLMPSDPAYKDMCVQYNSDNTLSLSKCTLNSTRFNYINNRLEILGSNPRRCLNLKGGKYTNGSPIDAVECDKARQDTVTWFTNVAPPTDAEKAAAAAAAAKKKLEQNAAAAKKKAELTAAAAKKKVDEAAAAAKKKLEQDAAAAKKKEKEDREKKIAAALTTLAAGGSIPQNNQIAAQNSISQTDANALDLQDKMSLLKNVQKMVRNELIASRSTDCLLPEEGCPMSDSCAQGKEYEKSSYKDTPKKAADDKSCPPMPNMSEYIKKDKIPCWGCSLDY
jgi:hypothetical protein